MKLTANNQSNTDYSCDCLVEFVNTEDISLTLNKKPKIIQDSIMQLHHNGDLTDNTTPRMVHPINACQAKRLLIVPVNFNNASSNPTHAESRHIASLAKTIATAIQDYPIQHLAIAFDDRFIHTQEDSPKKSQKNNSAQTNTGLHYQPNHQRDAEVFATTLINATYSRHEFKGKDHQKQVKLTLKKNPSIKKVTILTAHNTIKEIQAGLKAGQAIGSGMALARHLGDAPPNICTPQYLTTQAKKMAKKHPKLSTKVLGKKELKTLGAGAFLSVAQGSIHPPQLITMDYKGGKAGTAPIVLVGKGLTFDSGGISLKPGAAMDEMKYDMCGAASVFGAIEAAAILQLPLNIIGVIAAAENMPSAQATRPGDIVTTMSGQTVEILNTDAEGRLVLCDTLTYVQRYKPQAIIDLATLTGACIVALGHHTTAVMSNRSSFSQELHDISMHINDPCWPLPLWPEYTADLKSNFADIPNIGSGKGAGTIIAGAYLQKFVDENTPWAHLDIAGVAWNSGAAKGATGRPVHLLVSYLMKQALLPNPVTSLSRRKKYNKK